MNLSNEELDLAIFVCVEQEAGTGASGMTPIGTAFFALTFMQGKPIGYVVTAAHVLEGVGNRRFFLRINTDTGFTDFETTRDEWFVHDTADVAINRFRGSNFNLRAVGPEQFIDARHQYHQRDPETISYSGLKTGNLQRSNRIPVEVGHNVAIIGLFVQSYGSASNLPVARFGQIARMPGEPMRVRGPGETYREVVGYLIECQSWGGYSGSPVLWSHPIARLIDVDAPRKVPEGITVTNGKIWVQQPDAEVRGFLGMVTGHFDIEQKARTEGDIVGSIITAINSGIAIVTPAEMIRQLLNRDDVIEERKHSRT